MTYQDLINELKDYSSEQLQQDVTFLFCDDFKVKCDDQLSAEEVSFLTCCDTKDQIYIIV
jgi:hypothetical protein